MSRNSVLVSNQHKVNGKVGEPPKAPRSRGFFHCPFGLLSLAWHELAFVVNLAGLQACTLPSGLADWVCVWEAAD